MNFNIKNKGEIEMDYKDLADLIFPDVKPIEYYEENIQKEI